MSKTNYLDLLNKVVQEHEERKSYTINSKILLIDGLNNYIRTWIVQPTLNSNGVHVGGIVGFLKSLGLIIRTLNPTRVIVVFDGKDGSSKRKKKFNLYKGNRGHGLRLNRAYDWSSDEEEKQQMIFQLKRVIEYLKNLPVDIILLNNLEADDVIGYITSELSFKDDIKNITIVSTDKDFFQLVNDKVEIWNPVKKKLINKKTILNDYNITPENFLLFKGIDGDSSDNIPGVKGVGLKTFIKNVSIITSNKKISIDDVLECIQNNTKLTRVHQIILDNIQQYKLNMELMDISGSYISSSIKLKILEKFKKYSKSINLTKLQKLFLEDNLQGSFPDFNKWLAINFNYLNSFRK